MLLASSWIPTALYIGFGEQHVHLAPAGKTVVKRLARQDEQITRIIILVEAAAQALLMRHEQVAMQRHHAQTQVSAAGNDEFGMLHAVTVAGYSPHVPEMR